jgi:hypothetical protein
MDSRACVVSSYCLYTPSFFLRAFKSISITLTASVCSLGVNPKLGGGVEPLCLALWSLGKSLSPIWMH